MAVESQVRIRILVIDDDEDDFVLTRDLLRDADAGGFVLEWAETYEAGLDALRSGDYAVALVDYRLGSRSGLDLLREADAGRLPTPVVLLTGQGDRDVDLDAMRAGAVDYLSKSLLDAALLERTVRYAIRQKETEAALRQALRERDEVLAIVSHDLRNPLSAVRMGLKVLDDAVSGGKDLSRARAYLEIIGRAVGQMDRLIEDLLDVAKIEAGKLSLRRRIVAMGQLVEEAVAALRTAADSESVRLVAEIDPDMPTALVDADRVVQVLSNVLGNAIRFTPEHGTVTVRASAADGEVRISVRDTGPGIPPEDLPHIFDRFWQARTLRRGGAGLGLAIARGLVEAHHGRIEAESEPGVGSVFHVILPVSPPDPSG